MKSFDKRPTVGEYPGGNEILGLYYFLFTFIVYPGGFKWEYMVVFLKVLYWDFLFHIYIYVKKTNTPFGIQLFLIYIYVKKTNTPFWNSADEQNLKLLTFKQSHVYNTSAFCYPPPNFHRYGVVYSGQILEKKMFFQLFLIFHYFIGVVPP